MIWIILSEFVSFLLGWFVAVLLAGSKTGDLEARLFLREKELIELKTEYLEYIRTHPQDENLKKGE
jgi:hypothetical protein